MRKILFCGFLEILSGVINLFGLNFLGETKNLRPRKP
jgi:hypothetical protein